MAITYVMKVGGNMPDFNQTCRFDNFKAKVYHEDPLIPYDNYHRQAVGTVTSTTKTVKVSNELLPEVNSGTPISVPNKSTVTYSTPSAEKQGDVNQFFKLKYDLFFFDIIADEVQDITESNGIVNKRRVLTIKSLSTSNHLHSNKYVLFNDDLFIITSVNKNYGNNRIVYQDFIYDPTSYSTITLVQVRNGH